jgi:N utilization substance protein A
VGFRYPLFFGVDKMDVKLNLIIEQMAKERGISKEVIIQSIEHAIQSAYKKRFKEEKSLKVKFDEETGKIRVFKDNEEVTTGELGRMAAQTARQVMLQKFKEIEKNLLYEEFKGKEGEIITGVVQRFGNKKGKKTIYVDVGKIEGILPPAEQNKGETYNIHERFKFYILEVRKTTKGEGVNLILSRTHPNLVKKLFEMEVPEIKDKIIEIKRIAREPGVRTKIAVKSNREDVEPVGTCIGQKSTRIQIINEELRGEKIDIIPYSEDISEFVKNALSPAKISDVVVDEENKTVKVIVSEDQISLAIGKNGQNVRLASKLIGWKIDIIKEGKEEKIETTDES